MVGSGELRSIAEGTRVVEDSMNERFLEVNEELLFRPRHVSRAFTAYSFGIFKLGENLTLCQSCHTSRAAHQGLLSAIEAWRAISEDASALIISDKSKFLFLATALKAVSRALGCEALADLFVSVGHHDIYSFGLHSATMFEKAVNDRAIPGTMPMLAVLKNFAIVVGQRSVLVCCLLEDKIPGGSYFATEWKATVEIMDGFAPASMAAGLREMQRVRRFIAKDTALSEKRRGQLIWMAREIEQLCAKINSSLWEHVVVFCIMGRHYVCEKLLAGYSEYSPLRLNAIIETTGAWKAAMSFEAAPEELAKLRANLPDASALKDSLGEIGFDDVIHILSRFYRIAGALIDLILRKTNGLDAFYVEASVYDMSTRVVHFVAEIIRMVRIQQSGQMDIPTPPPGLTLEEIGLFNSQLLSEIADVLSDSMRVGGDSASLRLTKAATELQRTSTVLERVFDATRFFIYRQVADTCGVILPHRGFLVDAGSVRYFSTILAHIRTVLGPSIDALIRDIHSYAVSHGPGLGASGLQQPKTLQSFEHVLLSVIANVLIRTKASSEDCGLEREVPRPPHEALRVDIPSESSDPLIFEENDQHDYNTRAVKNPAQDGKHDDETRDAALAADRAYCTCCCGCFRCCE